MKNDTQYFNVITTGYGYLNNARIVTPTKGDPYLCVRASLMEGSSENIRYVYIDSIVRGDEAIALVTAHMSDICNKNNKVLAAVDFGSLNPTPFIFERGDKAGQAGVSLKASLLRIRHLKIDDKVIFVESKDEQNTDQASTKTPSSDASAPSVESIEEAKVAPTAVAEVVTEPVASSSVVSTIGQGGNAVEAPKLKVVKLEKDAPDFLARKADLKQRGYRWDSNLTAWVFPEAA